MPFSCVALKNRGQSISAFYTVKSLSNEKLRTVYCDFSKNDEGTLGTVYIKLFLIFPMRKIHFSFCILQKNSLGTMTSKRFPASSSTCKETTGIHRPTKQRWYRTNWNGWISAVRWIWRRASLQHPSTAATTLVSLWILVKEKVPTSVYALTMSKWDIHMPRWKPTICQSSPFCNWLKETQWIRILAGGHWTTVLTAITPTFQVSCWRRISPWCPNRVSSNCDHHF